MPNIRQHGSTVKYKGECIWLKEIQLFLQKGKSGYFYATLEILFKRLHVF